MTHYSFFFATFAVVLTVSCNNKPYCIGVTQDSAINNEVSLINNDEGNMVIIDVDGNDGLPLAHYIFNRGQSYFTALYDNNGRVSYVFQDDGAWKFRYGGNKVSYCQVRSSENTMQIRFDENIAYRTFLDKPDAAAPVFSQQLPNVIHGINEASFIYDIIKSDATPSDEKGFEWINDAVTQVNRHMSGYISKCNVKTGDIERVYRSFRLSSKLSRLSIVYADEGQALKEKKWNDYCKYWERKYTASREKYEPYFAEGMVDVRIVSYRTHRPIAGANLFINDNALSNDRMEFVTDDNGVCHIPIYAHSKRIDTLIVAKDGYSGFLARNITYPAISNQQIYLENMHECTPQGAQNYNGSGVFHAVQDYDMRQNGGNFRFSYYTDSAPDHIYIYDGSTADYALHRAKLLFDWYGATNTLVPTENVNINFQNRTICVVVDGGTNWGYIVRCPR